MEIGEERKEVYQKPFTSLNEIISSSVEINPNQISYNQSSTIETFQPQNQDNNMYTKEDLGENDITNIKFEEKEILDEETESTTKITSRIIKADKPILGKTYEKRIISKTITQEGPNHTTIIKTSNIVNENSKYQNHNKVTYTRPLPQGNYKSIQNNRYKIKNNLPKTNVNKSYIISNKNVSSSQTITNNNNNRTKNNLLMSSQSFLGNKMYLNKPDFINTVSFTHRAHSPEIDSVKRKTINRGEDIKNVQITHIICSTKPSNFHITEKLETDNIKSNPIQISTTDREKLSKGGKTSFTSSCHNVKPIIQNLKGKTTIYQHARGIGMTNDRRGNINPLFHNSEIKKLEPIVKEKEKEKVEYIENFRSNKNKKNNNNVITSTRNYNYTKGVNNVYQNQNYNTAGNTNRSNVNSSRVNVNNNRGRYLDNNNNDEDIKN